MGFAEKILNALQEPLGAEYIHLTDDDGMSGFVVSSRFENMSGLERQRLIDRALRNASDPLSEAEQRRILMIAGLTPLEYESVGARVRVDKIQELADGSLEVLLQGSHSDAMYVRGALKSECGATTTPPERSRGENGTRLTFRVKGTEAVPLTKERAISVLQADQYIEVMQNA